MCKSWVSSKRKGDGVLLGALKSLTDRLNSLQINYYIENANASGSGEYLQCKLCEN